MFLKCYKPARRKREHVVSMPPPDCMHIQYHINAFGLTPAYYPIQQFKTPFRAVLAQVIFSW